MMMAPSDSSYEHTVREANQLFHAQRYHESFAKYEALVAQGYFECAPRLGWMALKGLGRPESYEEALEWYKLAAEHGVPDAQFTLASLYASTENHDLEIEWYRRAADQGYAPAMYRLGLIYRMGRGVDRNENLAIQMFREAANRGHLFAQQKLNRRLFDGSEGLWGRVRGLWHGSRILLLGFFLSLRDESDPRILE